MTNESKPSGLDEVLKILGPFGKYSVYSVGLLLFPSFVSGLIGLAYNFEAIDINYRCEVPECEVYNSTHWLEYAIPLENGVLSKCKVYQHDNNSTEKCSMDAFDTGIIQECDSYVYSDQGSIVKDFNLGCQNWKRTLVGTVHHSGYFIALLLTGLISDRYGRTVAISVASFMNGVFGIARSFSTSYVMMLVFEFLETALGAGHYTSAFVMAMEFVGPRGRAFATNMINFVHVIGVVILTALAWWLQSWRSLLRIVFVPAFFPALYFIILKETPRWLMTKGRREEAVTVLRNAAKMNKVDIPEHMLKNLYLNNKFKTQGNTEIDVNGVENQGKKNSLFWQVIKSKIIMTRLVICSYMWMSGTFIYYGLSINSVSLAGNKYLNFMISALVEIPANFMVFILIDRIGRKRLLTSTFLLSGCMCIGLLFLPKDQSTWSLILYLSGKFFGTMAYSTIYVYVSEVFPTSVRQTLFSFCSTMGRFGTSLAPQTPLLAFYYRNLPSIVFGCVALSASILTLALPETLNVILPDNIEDAENISKREI